MLLRPVNSMVEFKQIIGRGTRLFDNKYYFTIYDFVGAAKNFEDAEWDGDPFCPVCGNYPCTCNKKPKQPCPKCGQTPCVCPKEPPEPCPVCGHLPCTCQGQGGKKKDAIEVWLSEERKLELFTKWEEKVQFGDELIGVDELVVRLFGAIPRFFDGAEDLRKKWEHPDTRKVVMDRLEQEGFGEDKLLMIQRVMQKEKCDLLDVLEYLAYSEQPIERAERVRRVKEKYFNDLAEEQSNFFTFILDFYVRNGFKELAMDKLKDFINIKYNSMTDAKRMLNMTVQDLRAQYIALQSALYNKPSDTTVRARRLKGKRYTLTEMMEEMK